MNYYPHHIGDFRSGTVNMSRLSRWIYRDMMDIYYDTERPLPLDLDALCDMLGIETDAEIKVVERLLRFKFEKSEDGYCHARCDQEIAAYHAKASTAKANGSRGGRPKKTDGNPGKPSGFPSGSDPEPTGSQEETGLKTNQEPITNNHKKEEAAAAPPPHTHVHTPAHEDGPDAPPLSAPADSEPMKPQARYAVLLRTWERERGKASRTTSADPRLSAWAERGITEDQLREAYGLAVADREIAGDTGPISAGFLDVFLAKLQQQAAGGKASALDRPTKSSALLSDPLAWAATWSGIVAKGAELGIEQHAGEFPPEFKARVHAAAGLTDADKSRLLADHGVRA